MLQCDAYCLHLLTVNRSMNQRTTTSSDPPSSLSSFAPLGPVERVVDEQQSPDDPPEAPHELQAERGTEPKLRGLVVAVGRSGLMVKLSSNSQIAD